MQEQLQQRLAELRTEYASGQKILADLESQQAHIREMLLRISGAIQVLEEELSKAGPVAGSNGPVAAEEESRERLREIKEIESRSA
jgi:hypothetical protein